MPSRKKKQQAQRAAKETVSAKCYSAIEVDPVNEEPSLLEALREKNKDALRHVLDPSCGPFKSSNPNTVETVWYLTSISHHMTGNLDLLTDVTPVYDRWIKSTLGIGPPAQALARGSVNSRGIILHDVWFVPDINVNVVSVPQLGLEWHMDAAQCQLRRSDDGEVLGTGHLGNDCMSLTSSISVGTRLQVCGKGSVRTGQFMIPDVCYVPGLGEDIISISQLIDTGFTLIFGADRFTVKKRCDGNVVGYGTYGGNQLFHLDSLKIPTSK